MAFGVVCTLIDNGMRHHSGQKMLCIHESNVDKSTDNVKLTCLALRQRNHFLELKKLAINWLSRDA